MCNTTLSITLLTTKVSQETRSKNERKKKFVNRRGDMKIQTEKFNVIFSSSSYHKVDCFLNQNI